MVDRISGLQALALALLAVIAFVVVATLVGATTGDFMLGTIVGYLAMAAVPLLWVRDLAVLGVRRVPPAHLAASILLGCSFLFVNLLVNVLLPFHPDTTRLESAIAGPSLPILFAGVAVVGPIAEELVFRGVVMPPLVRRLGAASGLALTAALFAAYHVSPPQLIPAFISGLALGALALRTRSIVPGMVAHVCNNATVIIVSRPEINLGGWIEAHPVPFLAVLLALLALGLALLFRTPPRA